MSKYNEVMEHIKVDDSMKQRILQNLEKSDRIESAAGLQKEGKADKGKAHDDRHDKDKVHDDEHDKGKVHDDRRDKDKADNNGHNHGRISSFGDRFSKSVRRFGGLAAMFAILLVGAAAVIQITGDHGNFSTSPSFNSAPSESAVMEAESEAPAEHAGSAVKDASPSVNLDSEQVQDVQESAAAENSTVGTTEGFDADLAKREDEAGTAQLFHAPEQSITSPQAVHSDEKAAGTSAVLDDSNLVNIAVVILVVIALIILLCVAVVVFVKKNGTKKRTD